MSLLKRFKQPKRLPNITVYALTAIVNGDVKASPLGVMPRFSDAYEKAIRDKHHPVAPAYINDRINDCSVVLCWRTEGIEAVSFLSADAARGCPGFSAIEDEDLLKLDSLLTHFPR